jgi:hypothetical protein
MKRCPNCLKLMPDDETRCIQCGHDVASVQADREEPIQTIESAPLPEPEAFSFRNIRFRDLIWRRVFATLLASKLFFLASCTGGMVAGAKLHDDMFLDSGVREGADRRMTLVAMAPGAGGKPVAHQVMYGELEKFRLLYPEHSFLLPPGSGRVEDPAAGTSTAYTVHAAGAGRVLVETRFNQDLLDVFGRYEATEREIRPLYSKAGSTMLFALTFGFALACVLGFTGLLLQYFDT